MSKSKQSLNVLFTCIGRRVSLVNGFRSAAKDLKIGIKVFGTDRTELSPALQLCDAKFVTCPIKDEGYIKEILRIVRNNKIDLLIPTIDTELKSLADNKEKFEKLGCKLLVSSPEVVDICQDKRKTFIFLKRHNFDTPQTMSLAVAMKDKKLTMPRFLKPWDGSASKGSQIVKNRKELEFFGKRIKNCIVQEFIKGQEFTCDAYVDFNMNVRCVVPRMRIEVRGGEVSKGQTCKDAVIMKAVKEVVDTLGAGPGIITIQLISNGCGIKFIEINPRFGGGAPLGIGAGANYPKWILQEMIGQKPKIQFDGFKDGLIMLRYDAEVWKQ